MNLTEKLESLKAEKAQKEAEKDAAHQRIIVLNRLIKQAEGLIKDANEIFQEKVIEMTDEENLITREFRLKE